MLLIFIECYFHLTTLLVQKYLIHTNLLVETQLLIAISAQFLATLLVCNFCYTLSYYQFKCRNIPRIKIIITLLARLAKIFLKNVSLQNNSETQIEKVKPKSVTDYDVTLLAKSH